MLWDFSLLLELLKVKDLRLAEFHKILIQHYDSLRVFSNQVNM
jgi:hypothetical protein